MLTIDRLMANPDMRKLIAQLMQEIQLVAAADDCEITDEFIQRMLAYTIDMIPYRTSMKIDYDEGRSLEIAAMFDRPLKFARAQGVDMPKIGMLYQQLQFLDSNL
jgi:2-dehydropantoate 2-reductase